MAVFNEDELKIIGEYNMPGIYGAPDSIVPKYNYPITPKENMIRMLEGKKTTLGSQPDAGQQRGSAFGHAGRPGAEFRRHRLVRH